MGSNPLHRVDFGLNQIDNTTCVGVVPPQCGQRSVLLELRIVPVVDLGGLLDGVVYRLLLNTRHSAHLATALAAGIGFELQPAADPAAIPKPVDVGLDEQSLHSLEE